MASSDRVDTARKALLMYARIEKGQAFIELLGRIDVDFCRVFSPKMAFYNRLSS